MASSNVVCTIPDHTAFPRGQIKQSKLRKKVKSKGQLVHRSAGIPPFSAWVEPVSSSQTSAMHDAQSEELKLKRVIHDKAARLKDFQSQVQSRVRMIERVKRQEQLGKSVEAVEIVRNIVHQSSFPRVVPPSMKTHGMSKQDTCSFRHGADQPIMRPITRGILAHSHEAVDKASQLLEEHAKEIRQSNKHARAVLKSRAVDGTGNIIPEDDLPGGRWDPCSQTNKTLPQYEDNNEHEGQPVDIIKKDNSGDYWMGPDEIRDVTDIEEIGECNSQLSEIPQWLAQEDQSKVTVFNPSIGTGCKIVKKVAFVEQNSEHAKKGNVGGRVDIQGSEKFLRKKAIEDLLKPGKVAEDSKQQQKSQMALYRKLFMDIEREQVREKIRMKEHRKRMAEIKVEKEINRLEIEHKHKKMLELEEEHALVMQKEQRLREDEENKEIQKLLEQRHAKLQKSKESERFIKAMKAVLKDKIRLKGIKIQPLCACGSSVWDTNPDTCANNCIYYKNPKEYAKALSSLLNSLDL